MGVRKECHDRFHTPVFQMFGTHAISPGFFEHNGVLWLTFGHHDYDPDGGPMTEFFEPAKKSEYYAAREAAGLEDTA